MKKYFISLSLAALLLLVPFFVSAQDTNTESQDQDTNTLLILNAPESTEAAEATETTETTNTAYTDELDAVLEDPGTLPGSTFYFLKTWGEGIHMFFTFDDSKKAELEYRYTLRRYAEIQKLLEKGKTDLAEKQLTKAEQKTERLQQRIETATQNSSGNKDDLVAKLESLQSRHQDVLMSVYDKVPEQAQESILRALENSTQGIQNAIDHVKGSDAAEQFDEEVQTRLENYGQEKKNEVQTRLEAIRKNKNETTSTDTNSDTSSDTNTDTNTENDDAVNSDTNQSDEDTQEIVNDSTTVNTSTNTSTEHATDPEEETENESD